MFCKYCGARLEEDYLFCAECGKRIIFDVKEETKKIEQDAALSDTSGEASACVQTIPEIKVEEEIRKKEQELLQEAIINEADEIEKITEPEIAEIDGKESVSGDYECCQLTKNEKADESSPVLGTANETEADTYTDDYSNEAGEKAALDTNNKYENYEDEITEEAADEALADGKEREKSDKPVANDNLYAPDIANRNETSYEKNADDKGEVGKIRLGTDTANTDDTANESYINNESDDKQIEIKNVTENREKNGEIKKQSEKRKKGGVGKTEPEEANVTRLTSKDNETREFSRKNYNSDIVYAFGKKISERKKRYTQNPIAEERICPYCGTLNRQKESCIGCGRELSRTGYIQVVKHERFIKVKKAKQKIAAKTADKKLSKRDKKQDFSTDSE